ncbi:MAG TPA: hydrogenase expression protein HypE, partial [Pseudolabrys sp.]
MALLDSIRHAETIEAHRPWPRAIVDAEGWQNAIDHLTAGRCTLLGLWGDAGAVHMALIAEKSDVVVLTYACRDGRYPSVGAKHPPAIRLERAIQTLFGFEGIDAPDTRPWLDLGFWDVVHPLGKRTMAQAPAPYAFLPAEGEALHQIAVGPVHAGIIEPGHFRFTANGEHVVRLEQRLGYVHKGVESLMTGAQFDRAAKLAGRISGDSTVAYAFAFAQAAEAALETGPPPRAVHLRALMAELERLANHFGDIGAICNDASFPLMLAQCG